jgi:importin subunit alpha-1
MDDFEEEAAENDVDNFDESDNDPIDQSIINIISDDPIQQTRGTEQVLKLLKSAPHGIAAVILTNDLIPKFLTFSASPVVPLACAAAGVLGRAALVAGMPVGRQTAIVAGLVTQLRNSNAVVDVRAAAIHALAQIAGDRIELRDLVLSLDAMTPFVACFDENHPLLMRAVAAALANCCIRRHAPLLDGVEPIALKMLRVLINNPDMLVVVDACTAFSHLTQGTNDRIQAVLDTGVLPRLVELLAHRDVSVSTPALRCIGNIVSGDDVQTEQVVALGAVDTLAKLLNSRKRAIRKETCWALSNIASGSQSQIQALIDSGVVPSLVTMMAHAPLEIRKEVCWVLANASEGGSSKQITYFACCNALPALIEMLSNMDTKIVSIALDGIANFCSKAQLHPLHCPVIGEAQQLVLETMDNFSLLPQSLHERAGDVLLRAVFVLEMPRMTEVCVALHELDLPALISVHILDCISDGAELVLFHHKWAIATKVKHFKDPKK